MSEFLDTAPIRDLPQGLQVIHQLSEGSTCIAYKVEDSMHTYCMKRLRPELAHEELYRQVFRKEYELGRHLSSPYLPRYVSLHEGEDDCYILTEYVDGMTLTESLADGYRRKDVTVGTIDWFFKQILSGLAELHAHGIIHLDLTPENVMVRRVNRQAVILDLGCCYHDAYKSTMGRTPGYSAPEVDRPDATIDERADVYSVGCLLRYVLDQAPASMRIHRKRYQRILDRCCAENPDDRFASAEEVKRQFETDPRSFAARHRRFVRGVVIALLVLVGLMGADYHFHMVDRAKLSLMGYNRSVEGLRYAVVSFDEMTCQVASVDDSLDNAYIPEKVKISGLEYRVVAIADSAFAHHGSIQSIALPQSVRSIGESAFAYCSELTTITLPDSLEELSRDLFYNCAKLRSVHLPKNLKRMGRGAFVACEKLEEVVLPEGLETIDLDAFGYCKGLKEVRIPASIHRMERGIFWSCTSLETVYLPETIEGIGDYVFWHCDSLKDIYVGNSEPVQVTDIFGDTKPTIHVPQGAKVAYASALNWREHLIVEEESM